MMPDWRIVAVVFAVGAASYAMRAGGFLAASALPQSGPLPRLLRLAPGNLLVSFPAARILEGGWASLVGSLGPPATMTVPNPQFAAFAPRFAATPLTPSLL